MLVLQIKLICLLILFFLWSAMQESRREQLYSNPSKLKTRQFLWLVYILFMLWLSYSWYGKQDLVGFHWFDDSGEWMLMDKIGHFTVNFHICRILYNTITRNNEPENKRFFTAIMYTLLITSPIEVLDGLVANYGASAYDLIFNTAGIALFVAQRKIFNREVIMPKIGLGISPFAHHRPELLGSNLTEQMVKDYNSVIHWMEVPIGAVTGNRIAAYLPTWLTLNVGYGIEGMISANPEKNLAMGFHSSTEYVLAPGIRFYSLPIKNKIINNILLVFECFKVPTPAIIFSQGRLYFSWLYLGSVSNFN